MLAWPPSHLPLPLLHSVVLARWWVGGKHGLPLAGGVGAQTTGRTLPSSFTLLRLVGGTRAPRSLKATWQHCNGRSVVQLCLGPVLWNLVQPAALGCPVRVALLMPMLHDHGMIPNEAHFIRSCVHQERNQFPQGTTR